MNVTSTTTWTGRKEEEDEEEDEREKRKNGKVGKVGREKGKREKKGRKRGKKGGGNVSKREVHAFMIGNFYRTWLLAEVVVDNLPFLERADRRILHGCDREQSQKFCQIPRVWHGDHFLRDQDVEQSVVMIHREVDWTCCWLIKTGSFDRVEFYTIFAADFL